MILFNKNRAINDVVEKFYFIKYWIFGICKTFFFNTYNQINNQIIIM